MVHGNVKHGMTKKRLYVIWQHMRYRCSKVFHEDWDNYGKRGIRVCPEWEDFMVFQEWAMANGYSEKLTLDRMDNNGNYTPDNCRWADRLTQNRNSRHNRMITAFGETKPMSAWVEDPRCKTSKHGLRKRLVRGWSPEQAITCETIVNQYSQRS